MPIAIIGMHRSGTSLVARLLNLAGMFLGDERDMLAADIHNEAGYWELRSFVQYNDRILSEFGGAWRDPPMMPPDWLESPRIRALQAEAAAFIAGTFGDCPVWGWKDPRTTLTLPFWKSIVPDLKCVVCVRNPLDVAASLQMRDKLATRHSLALWQMYTELAFSSTAPQDRFTVSFDDFLGNYRESLPDLLNFVGLPLPAEGSTTLSDIEEFVNSGLRHHGRSTDDVLRSPEVPFYTRLTYQALRRPGSGLDKIFEYGPADSSPAHVRAVLDDESAHKWSALHGLAAHIAHDDQLIADLTSTVEEQKRDILTLTDTLVETDRIHAQRLAEELRSHAEEITERDRRAAIQRAEMDRLQQRVTELTEGKAFTPEEQQAVEATRRDNDLLGRRLDIIEARLSFRLLERVWRQQLRMLPPESWRGRLWLTAMRALKRRVRYDPAPESENALQILGRHLPPFLQRADTGDDGEAGEPEPSDSDRSATLYEEWARCSDRIRYNPQRAARLIDGFVVRPVVSILMPVYNPPEEFLVQAIDSVRRQFYPHWELCICDDSSPAAHVRDVLDRYSTVDERIKVVFAERNTGIAGATNRALEMATGEFVGLLDHDDELTPDALFDVVGVLQRSPADVIYSDEDKLDEQGRRCDPFFKPAWTPDLLLSSMFTGHFTVYRKGLVEQVGGFRPGFDGSQDHDLALRCTERAESIVHIPKVLYHWRKAPGSAAQRGDAKPEAHDAGKRAIGDALQRRGVDAQVCDVNVPGFYNVRRTVKDPGKVSILIPTRDRLYLLRKCIQSIEAVTGYDVGYEIIIVNNGSRSPATLEYLENSPHTVIHDDRPFNYARLINRAARMATGQYLLLLNNDTEVFSGTWLTAMVEHAQRPEVGAVGAKLLYPDGRIQHAGVILGLGGVGDHSQKFIDGKTGTGYFNFPNITRNYSAVTGACLLIRRDLYEEVGELDEEHLPVSFNDIDLCLRVRERGYLIVYTPNALLTHHESASREQQVDAREEQYMMDTWGAALQSDSFYNPNLTLTEVDFSIDFSRPESTIVAVEQTASNEVVGVIDANTRIGQEFLSRESSLCAVSIKFATYRSRCAGTLLFRLQEAGVGEHDDTVVEIDAAVIRDNAFHIVSFEPRDDSEGKIYYFSVEWRNWQPGAQLSIWKTGTTDEDLGPYYKNGRAASGTLAFTVHCQMNLERVWNSAPIHG